jgi:hypothetical protein
MQFFVALLPVALFHTVGHVSACLSFSQMAVSFAHIVKSAEPVFSVALSGPLLGQAYPAYVWLSLLPIVAGCSLSAMKVRRRRRALQGSCGAAAGQLRGYAAGVRECVLHRRLCGRHPHPHPHYHPSPPQRPPHTPSPPLPPRRRSALRGPASTTRW